MPTEPVLGLDPRDERCFRPIHVYDAATSRPVAVILRPGRTLSGKGVRGHLRRLVRRNGDAWLIADIYLDGAISALATGRSEFAAF